jgi:hypothetical protein
MENLNIQDTQALTVSLGGIEYRNADELEQHVAQIRAECANEHEFFMVMGRANQTVTRFRERATEISDSWLLQLEQHIEQSSDPQAARAAISDPDLAHNVADARKRRSKQEVLKQQIANLWGEEYLSHPYVVTALTTNSRALDFITLGRILPAESAINALSERICQRFKTQEAYGSPHLDIKNQDIKDVINAVQRKPRKANVGDWQYTYKPPTRELLLAAQEGSRKKSANDLRDVNRKCNWQLRIGARGEIVGFEEWETPTIPLPPAAIESTTGNELEASEASQQAEEMIPTGVYGLGPSMPRRAMEEATTVATATSIPTLASEPASQPVQSTPKHTVRRSRRSKGKQPVSGADAPSSQHAGEVITVDSDDTEEEDDSAQEVDGGHWLRNRQGTGASNTLSTPSKSLRKRRTKEVAPSEEHIEPHQTDIEDSLQDISDAMEPEEENSTRPYKETEDSPTKKRKSGPDSAVDIFDGQLDCGCTADFNDLQGVTMLQPGTNPTSRAHLQVLLALWFDVVKDGKSICETHWRYAFDLVGMFTDVTLDENRDNLQTYVQAGEGLETALATEWGYNKIRYAFRRPQHLDYAGMQRYPSKYSIDKRMVVSQDRADMLLDEICPGLQSQWDLNGSIVIDLFRYLRDSDMFSIFQEEMRMYRHHLRTIPEGEDTWTLRNCYHSIFQQIVHMDPVLYILNVCLRPDHAADLVALPQPCTFAKEGGETVERSCMLPILSRRGRYENIILIHVPIIGEDQQNCSEVISGLHKEDIATTWQCRLFARGDLPSEEAIHPMTKNFFNAGDATVLKTNWRKEMCLPGEVRLTSIMNPQGSRTAGERLFMDTWKIAVGVSEVPVGDICRSTIEEIREAHRTMSPPALNSAEGTPLSVAVTVHTHHALMGAQLTRIPYTAGEVRYQQEVLFGQDDASRWELIEEMRNDLVSAGMAAFKMLRQVESVNYGKASYFTNPSKQPLEHELPGEVIVMNSRPAGGTTSWHTESVRGPSELFDNGLELDVLSNKEKLIARTQ